MSMKIQTRHGVWYIVEVNGETHYIPPVCVSLEITSGMTVRCPDMDDTLTPEMWKHLADTISDYVEVGCDEDSLESVEARECWGAQYHMPGYMDQTDWVLGDTEEEAVAECKELYG